MKELQSLYNNINAFFSSTYAYVFCFIGLVLIALFIFLIETKVKSGKKYFHGLLVQFCNHQLEEFVITYLEFQQH